MAVFPLKSGALPLPGRQCLPSQLSLCSPNTFLLMQENYINLSSLHSVKLVAPPGCRERHDISPGTTTQTSLCHCEAGGGCIFRELRARVFSFPLILMLLPSQGPCAQDQQALLESVFCSFINTQTHYRIYRKY